MVAVAFTLRPPFFSAAHRRPPRGPTLHERPQQNPNSSRRRRTRRELPPATVSTAGAAGSATTFDRLPLRESPSTSTSYSEISLNSCLRALTPADGGKTQSVAVSDVESEECEDEVLWNVGDDSDDDDEDIVAEDMGIEEWEEGEMVEVKEKGVPAVMRCFDTAKIYVKSGSGGNGVVAFRREKFVPFGGPSGGDGGRGGDVYIEVDKAMNSLLPFRKSVHFRAGRGGHGKGQKQSGEKGEDVVISVPIGTVVRDATRGSEREGEILMELVRPEQKGLLLPGGRGGRGNASFKSGTNRVPKIAENGEKGVEM